VLHSIAAAADRSFQLTVAPVKERVDSAEVCVSRLKVRVAAFQVRVDGAQLRVGLLQERVAHRPARAARQKSASPPAEERVNSTQVSIRRAKVRVEYAKRASNRPRRA
jgi:hypothetical protein